MTQRTEKRHWQAESATWPDDSLALHTDLYQIKMTEAYWRDGVHERQAVFEVYYRKLPFENGYAVFAGLERVVRYLQAFHFTESDLGYLREEGVDEAFLTYLRGVRFTGTVHAMREGELVFPNQPMLRIIAPLAEAQLVETAILNIVNYQTLVATKAMRIRLVAGQDVVIEFGARRAQEMDAALWGARSAYIGGVEATSNVRAGKLFGIPTVGTHAHAFVQTYQDELTAFRKYATSHRDCLFLVDTYDVLRSGVPHAIQVAQEFGERIHFRGIRLDSGDLAELSKAARAQLDAAGYTEARIYATNDLDESEIDRLKQHGARIDVWGIGTRLITAYDHPALGAVYKMVSIEHPTEAGEMVDTIKISSNPEKVTTPGLKQSYRLFQHSNGEAFMDVIALESEDVQEGHGRAPALAGLEPDWVKQVMEADLKQLHVCIMSQGKLVYELPTLEQIREYARKAVGSLSMRFRRPFEPDQYPVLLTEACAANKSNAIEAVRNQLNFELA